MAERRLDGNVWNGSHYAALNCVQIVKIMADKEQCSLRNNVCIMFAECKKHIYDSTVRFDESLRGFRERIGQQLNRFQHRFGARL